MRTLIFCFDGTWNGRDDEHSTNVLKLHRGLNYENQVSFYFTGPGNDDGDSNIFDQFLGGAFGYGSWDIRDNALDVLRSVYQPGDQVAVIGFSRGAAIARMFCSEIFKKDINNRVLTVRFLGCFDTVGAYLPIGPSQQGLFHDLHVSPAVENAYHAVAVHEDRKSFTPNLMNARDGVMEVWFPGIHGDVGGGMPETGLSDCALQWMVDRLAHNGIETNVVTSPDPTAPISRVDGFYRRGARKVGVLLDDEWSDLEPMMSPF